MELNSSAVTAPMAVLAWMIARLPGKALVVLLRSSALAASDMLPSNTPRRWGCTLRRLISLRGKLLLPELQAPTSRLMGAHLMRWRIFSRRRAAAPTAFW